MPGKHQAYSMYLKPPAEATAEDVRTWLHEFAEDLASADLVHFVIADDPDSGEGAEPEDLTAAKPMSASTDACAPTKFHVRMDLFCHGRTDPQGTCGILQVEQFARPHQPDGVRRVGPHGAQAP